MSEIEKLMQNAGVEKKKKKMLDAETGETVLSLDAFYPEFTAEKQLELIKWLCQKTYRNYLLIRYDFTNYYWQIECNMTDSNRVDNFSEALSSVCNNLWQDLSEEEKQQVKGILE